jgi:hypothetical protein
MRLSGCLMDTMLLNKLMNLLLDSPRLANVWSSRMAFPKPRNSKSTSHLGE